MNIPFDLFIHLMEFKFNYGWTTKDGRTILPKDEEFKKEGFFENNCQVLKPNEFKYSKIGTCWELTLYEYEWLKEHNYNVLPVYFEGFTSFGNFQTHSFVIFESKSLYPRYYWFEWIWDQFRGINGPQINQYRVLDWIKEQINYLGTTIKFFGVANKIQVDKLLQMDQITPQDFLNLFKKGNENGSNC